MTKEEFNIFCGSLPQATFVEQWRGAQVWKIGGKVFAIGGWSESGLGITFKCSPQTFEDWKSVPGMRPAPYLASRGMSWLQWQDARTVSEDDLREHLWESYRLVGKGLTRAKKRELGSDADVFLD